MHCSPAEAGAWLFAPSHKPPPRAANTMKMNPMKQTTNLLAWAGALALAMNIVPIAQTTAGTIMIVTRYQQDLTWVGEDGDPNDGSPYERYKAAGMASPGDVAMAELLGDYGYVTRVIISQELFAGKVNPCTGQEANPEAYLRPSDPEFNVDLVIVSGSGTGAYAPPLLGLGVPIMMGEHTCLSDRSGRAGNIYMYFNGSQSGDESGPSASQYMYVLEPDHPIMKGIPLDDKGRVKLIRDPYPEESAHIPPGGFPNYEYTYAAQNVENAAPATTVIGVLDNKRERAVFAVADVGKELSNGETNQVRLVHFFVCEGGGNDSRRCFNALSDIGRVIFVRAAKWAMGEELKPYVPLGIKDVSVVGQSRIKVTWQGSAEKNYKIVGTTDLLGPADFTNWQTIVQDIPGVDGEISRTLDISTAPKVAYLRIRAAP